MAKFPNCETQPSEHNDQDEKAFSIFRQSSQENRLFYYTHKNNNNTASAPNPLFYGLFSGTCFPPQLTPSTSAEEGSFVCFFDVLKDGGGNVQSPTPQSPLLLSWSLAFVITLQTIASFLQLLCCYIVLLLPHHQLCMSHRPWGK